MEQVSLQHEEELQSPASEMASGDKLRQCAMEQQANWKYVSHEAEYDGLEMRIDEVRQRLRNCLASARKWKDTVELRKLIESQRLLEGVLYEIEEVKRYLAKLPYVKARDDNNKAYPRVLAISEEYMGAVDGAWSAASLAIYLAEIQKHDVLLLAETSQLLGCLKLVLVERALAQTEAALDVRGGDARGERTELAASLARLKQFTEHDWDEFLESQEAVHHILAQDPCGAYLRMEPESRGAYRQRVAELAHLADADEVHTAQVVLELTAAAQNKPLEDVRLTQRLTHVGYYLFEQGLPQLKQKIGYRPNLLKRLQNWLRSDSEIYILAIYILSLVIITAVMMPLVSHRNIWPVILTLFIALLPATQGATDLVNDFVTSLFTPRMLPKVDFSKGVPLDQTALVVVPTLLLNEKQVEELFEDLEVRYLANMDANLHFALLTDLPDSVTRPTPADKNYLVEKAVSIIDRLNAKYAKEHGGAFILLHRHRIYNVLQGVWMGWERKRGKLLDLNKLLMGEFDSFPVKAGPIKVLEQVKYVITLDTDTQLPGGTAARMVGTIAHPLNQAIIDPQKQIVTAGYGILQPRVGVSFASVSRSRFAAYYSGETGYDIYTRAVSDVYQDLFGEGSFTGKGIYEVSIFHQVMNHRFPNNALLSHDLIEGTYARAGLVSDIEVLDDYPSQYATHTRRKHRWVRGDWQIIHWLFSRVPDESNKLVRNPINAISKWKIFDNLRRSLIEPITMVLLVLGWFVLPGGALYWTIVTLLLLLFPSIIQLVFNFARVIMGSGTAGTAVRTFGSSFSFSVLNLAFLPHQTVLSVDAIVRTMVRRFVTGKRLLEWETAAQSEAGRSAAPLDRYLDLTPLLAAAIAIPLALIHRNAIYSAGPILLLWAVAPVIAKWLSSPPSRTEEPLNTDTNRMLEETAYATWRYFAEFGGEENRWLIPDNVREEGMQVVKTLSPTNIGLLLNARQSAVELGFITLPEFVRATMESLRTFGMLEKYNGHIFNWNSLDDLKPMQPIVVSTVDNGNLRASLYALHGGAVEMLNAPLLPEQLFTSLGRRLRQTGLIGPELSLERAQKGKGTRLEKSIHWLLSLPEFKIAEGASPVERDAAMRREYLQKFIEEYLPWLLPQFAPEVSGVLLPDFGELTLASVLTTIWPQLQKTAEDSSQAHQVEEARDRLQKLQDDLSKIAMQAEEFARDMRFDFLYNKRRHSLAIDYDPRNDALHASGYSMMASESRMAVFLAVANGEIPLQAWFRLSRAPVIVGRQATLASWTGTMFEYLMPTLWMHSYPDTLIYRAMSACVAIQRLHVRGRPWGISESSYAERDENGQYKYHAWGVAPLAMKGDDEERIVISPYSTFLALQFGGQQATANLRRMLKLGWRGEYGFYEAADYGDGKKPEVVRQWMAHHQGMSLLAITNQLSENAVQRWFHANPCVRALEYLLNERPFTPEVLNVVKQRVAESNAA